MITGLAASFDGHSVAYSPFGRNRVQVWDIASYNQVSEFDTILESGGSRLAISRDGAYAAAGAFGRRGLALYQAQSGLCCWQSQNLLKRQQVRFGSAGSQICSVSHSGPARVVGLATGEVVRQVPNVRWIADGGTSPVALVSDGVQ